MTSPVLTGGFVMKLFTKPPDVARMRHDPFRENGIDLMISNKYRRGRSNDNMHVDRGAELAPGPQRRDRSAQLDGKHHPVDRRHRRCLRRVDFRSVKRRSGLHHVFRHRRDVQFHQCPVLRRRAEHHWLDLQFHQCPFQRRRVQHGRLDLQLQFDPVQFRRRVGAIPRLDNVRCSNPVHHPFPDRPGEQQQAEHQRQLRQRGHDHGFGRGRIDAVDFRHPGLFLQHEPHRGRCGKYDQHLKRRSPGLAAFRPRGGLGAIRQRGAHLRQRRRRRHSTAGRLLATGLCGATGRR